MAKAKFILRFFFEWGGGCLWSGNDAAYHELGMGPLDLCEPCPLALSSETLKHCKEIGEWHDRSLNWNYPPDPGPWRQAECDRFNQAVLRLFESIQKELGPNFELINEQLILAEHPDLDKYLLNPNEFRR